MYAFRVLWYFVVFVLFGIFTFLPELLGGMTLG
jgi:hypothetical protein